MTLFFTWPAFKRGCDLFPTIAVRAPRRAILVLALSLSTVDVWSQNIGYGDIGANKAIDALKAWKNRDQSRPEQPRPKVPAKPAKRTSKPPQQTVTLPETGPVPAFSPRTLQRPPSDFLNPDSVVMPSNENMAFSNYDPQYGVSEAVERAQRMLIEKMQKDGFDPSIPYDPNYGVSEGSFAGILNDLESQAARLRKKPPTLTQLDKKRLDTLNQYFQATTFLTAGTAIAAGGVVAGTVVGAPAIIVGAIAISLYGGTSIRMAQQDDKYTSTSEKFNNAIKESAHETAWNTLTLGMGNALFPGIANPIAEMALDDNLKMLKKARERYRKAFTNGRPILLLNLPLDKVNSTLDQRFGEPGFNVQYIPDASRG